MAEVWLATDMSLSRQVAIKILKSTLATDPVVAERFRREAITVARLSHPNIVAVHDTIDFDGRQAVVMQLVNGKSLRQLLDEQKRLGPELTMHIGSCVAAALDAAHSAGLVHRDVKPGNIMITPDGRVLLTDFGIAKGLGSSDDLTSDNVMMGTAKYLSPEQVRGKKLDGRADLYALGLVLYECLAGRVPFLGESDADTALARLQRDPTDLTRLRATLPYGLAALIHELLARNPDDRPATGGELRNRLTRIASGIDDRTTTMTPPKGMTAAGAATPPLAPTPTPPVAPTGAAAAMPRATDPTPPRAASAGARADGRHSASRGSSPTPRQGPARPIKAPPPTRDRTPTSGSPRGVPSKQFQQRRTPSIIVVVLLLLAVIVGAVLLSEGGDSKGSSSTTTVAAAGTTPTTAAVIAGDGTAASIAAIDSFDPGDANAGDENPDQAALAIDGDTSTAWKTNCYNDKYFNGKPGVGLVVSLSDPSTGNVSVDVANGPYQLRVYASNADSPPTTVAGWGDPVQPKSAGTAPGTVTASISQPSRYVLVLLLQAASDNGCSAKFPYRGAISEIRFATA
ncbi:MAG: putative serine/threonine protein kinase [Ilumatobacteraceae bacterium]|nr:putative serine/threonine protein kinase [Ilumatobacteraceae bacterium]